MPAGEPTAVPTLYTPRSKSSALRDGTDPGVRSRRTAVDLGGSTIPAGDFAVLLYVRPIVSRDVAPHAHRARNDLRRRPWRPHRRCDAVGSPRPDYGFGEHDWTAA